MDKTMLDSMVNFNKVVSRTFMLAPKSASPALLAPWRDTIADAL
jgi:hypothetical protein